jgi:hypothetical protein
MIRHRIVLALVAAAALAVPVLASASPAELSVRQSSARRHSAGSPANRIHRAEPASLTSTGRTRLLTIGDGRNARVQSSLGDQPEALPSAAARAARR